MHCEFSGPKSTARGKVRGRDTWDNRADIAGDSMCAHCVEEKEVHGVGYETLGKNTVLYSRIDPCLLGDVARSELENFKDLFFMTLSCSVSVRLQDFHTPWYQN